MFNPHPVYKSVFSIGGIRILISLIALANTSETLYASLKALVCVLKNSNVRVDRHHAQVIGFVLKSKKSLLSMRVLHLVFSLVEQEHGFAELLGDLEIWCDDEERISDLEKALYEHFVNLLNEDRRAGEYFVRAGVLGSLLARTNVHTHNSLFSVISCLIRNELVTYGWFVVDTLGDSRGIERGLSKRVVVRNKCLQLLHTCLYVGKNLNVGFCEDVISTLGFDFVLLFCEPSVHVDTVVWGVRILMLLLNSSQSNKNKFRDGVSGAFCFKSLAWMQSRNVASEYACLGLKREVGRLDEIPDSPTNGGWKGGVGREGSVKGRESGGGEGRERERGNNGVGGWVRLSWALGQRVLGGSKGEEEFVELSVEVWLVICALVLSQGVRSTVGFGGGKEEGGDGEQQVRDYYLLHF